jgi:hypothetical protein
MTKKRLLFVLNEYPQISETYIASEINALWNNYEIEVLSFNKSDLTYRHSVPYHHIPHTDRRAIANLIKRFSPDIVHGHYIFLAEFLRDVSKSVGVPFTIRAHSFDILGVDRDKVARKADAINSPYCLGVLTFPFTVPLLESAGINRDKIQGCWPVVDVERFYDTSTNGKSVMNLGACIPKKKFEDFLRLAQQVPEKNFNLYALGYKVEEIKKTNDSMGDPVTIIPPIEPRDMPREYKKHEWLVYTACPRLATVGWPMTVAEAQAWGSACACGISGPTFASLSAMPAICLTTSRMPRKSSVSRFLPRFGSSALNTPGNRTCDRIYTNSRTCGPRHEAGNAPRVRVGAVGAIA